MSTFKDYLKHEAIIESLHDSLVNDTCLNEDMIGVLDVLQKMLSKFLNEGIEPVDTKKYLKYLAAFEQFFRFLQNKKMSLADEPGLGAFIDDGSERITDDQLEKRLNRQINTWSTREGYPNFKAVIESRYKQFLIWFEAKTKDELKIIADAVAYVHSKFDEYEKTTRSLSSQTN